MGRPHTHFSGVFFSLRRECRCLLREGEQRAQGGVSLTGSAFLNASNSWSGRKLV